MCQHVHKELQMYTFNQPQYTSPSYYDAMFPQLRRGGIPQPVQTIQQSMPQMQSLAYFVGSEAEMKNISPELNTMYIGINAKDKEIYVKRLTNDGLVDMEKYTLASTENKPKDKDAETIQTILAKVEAIENKIGAVDVTAVNTTSNVGGAAEQPNDGVVHTNDVG